MKKILLFLAVAIALSGCDFGKPSKEEMRAQLEKEIKDSIARVEKEKAEKKAMADSIADEVAKRLMMTGSGKSHPYRNIDYGSNKHAMIESWAGIVTSRRLTESDISGMSNDDLCLLRNLIFAIHGYRFKQARFLEFFNGYSWYTPMYSNVESSLSSVENYNVKFIKRHEW